jgi:hypothetical protein
MSGGGVGRGRSNEKQIPRFARDDSRFTFVMNQNLCGRSIRLRQGVTRFGMARDGKRINTEGTENGKDEGTEARRSGVICRIGDIYCEKQIPRFARDDSASYNVKPWYFWLTQLC